MRMMRLVPHAQLEAVYLDRHRELDGSRTDGAMRLFRPAGQKLRWVVATGGGSPLVGADEILHFKSGTSYEVTYQ
jgi:hypothetical protein